ncbi:cupin domain-containing protein [Amaricoccus sp.]|uniref:cupin domain-containing protein n=1 Tax=Amaricoccus sp. TaxID=1872485 RepID=UPI001B595E05|nr:cupin domain-containing protein [Amaricoccus sp.]MBP7002032.1 cupin domain-containing protein [Amaricoccus sp.]
MGVIDKAAAPLRTGSIYPEPFASMMRGRSSLRLGEAGGLTQFGVNLVMLEPGAVSSLRHWHEKEDEFVWIVSGELTLRQDGGETVMRPGDCAAFRAGDTDGHCFRNDTDAPASFLVVGTKAKDEVAHYSDVDFVLAMRDGKPVFLRRDGSVWTPDGSGG